MELIIESFIFFSINIKLLIKLLYSLVSLKVSIKSKKDKYITIPSDKIFSGSVKQKGILTFSKPSSIFKSLIYSTILFIKSKF